MQEQEKKIKGKSEFTGIAQIFSARTPKKAPSFEWQDLALKIINDLNIPAFKKGAVFKICKEYDKHYVENCWNDTKELCKAGDRWKYFFKVVMNGKNDKPKGFPSP